MRKSYKSLRQIQQKVLMLTLLPLLGSCSTTFIPGLDRILFSNSTAEVSPVVTADEKIPPTTDGTGATKGTDPIAKAGTNTKIAGELQSATRSPGNDGNPSSQPSADIAIEYGAISGQVLLLDEGSKPIAEGGTMITLTPQSITNTESDRQPQVHIIDMKNKIYNPRYSTINAGDQVVFVNSDRIRHNVFSSSGSNAFDLGTYGAGLKRAVTLREPGIVKIYCNIHAEMATFVAVGDQGLSTQTDEQGRYSINDVLPGTYELTIWNIRGESKRVVEISANQNLELVDRIDTTTQVVEPHKNKFGGDYSKNATLFEDEFY